MRATSTAETHAVRTDKALYDYAGGRALQDVNRSTRSSTTAKLQVMSTHSARTAVSTRAGHGSKASREIPHHGVFRDAPADF